VKVLALSIVDLLRPDLAGGGFSPRDSYCFIENPLWNTCAGTWQFKVWIYPALTTPGPFQPQD
jgi:hypothetical protein